MRWVHYWLGCRWLGHDDYRFPHTRCVYCGRSFR